VFINSDTGASANVDPRLRAFPTKGQDRGTGIRSSTYLRAYNSTSNHPSTCNEYWGHLGRDWSTQVRRAPTSLLLGFLMFASVQFVIGSVSIFNYPLDADKLLRLPDITIPDLERFLRIVHLKLYLMLITAPLAVFVTLYALRSMLSVLVLFRHTVLENVPVETKEPGSLNII
jgi:hypothetical protein